MHENVWLGLYGRMSRATRSVRDGLRVAGDGRRRAVPRGLITGACLAMLTAVVSLPRTTWAQLGVDGVFEIPVHPDVPTMMHLPDEITRARVNPGKTMRVTLIGRTLHVRPQSDVPVGLDALLEVETLSMLLTFRLHVVERVMDAREELVVVAMKSEQRAEDGPVGAEHAMRIDTGAGRHGPGHAPALAPPRAEPPAAPEPPVDIEQVAPPERERPVLDAGPRRFEISVQALAGLPGITEQRVAGYESTDARQTQLAFAARMSGARPDNWWAVVAGIGLELPLEPTVHARATSSGLKEMLELGGPRLGMDLGLRGHIGTWWRPTVHAAIGLQAHFRNTHDFRRLLDQPPTEPPIEIPGSSRRDMPLGGVFVFGLGFEHRRGDMLLGFEFQMRQGVPAEYRSMGAFLSAGYSLDQGP